MRSDNIFPARSASGFKLILAPHCRFSSAAKFFNFFA
jgi:hypothetical protein